MQIMIEMPEGTFESVKRYYEQNQECYALCAYVANGKPLPKGHGRLIDKDHMIARLEAASKFYGGENTDAFDERFSHGLKEAAIKVAEEPTIIEADKAESEDKE